MAEKILTPEEKEAAEAKAKADAEAAKQDPLKADLEKVKRTKLEKLQYRRKLIDKQIKEEVLDSVIENYSLSCDEEEYILIFTGLATDSSGELIDVVSDSDCEQADECDEDMESYEED